MLRECLYIASDHAGYELKTKLRAFFRKVQIPFTDLGINSEKSCDYPDLTHLLTSRIDEKSFGILICSSGVEISIAANRHKNIRCALCSESLSARLARKYNDVDILAFGGCPVRFDLAMNMIENFIKTPFDEGRHMKGIQKIEVG